MNIVSKSYMDKKEFEWCVQRPNSPLENSKLVNIATIVPSFVYPSFPKRIFNGYNSKSASFQAIHGKSSVKSVKVQRNFNSIDDIEFHVKRMISLSMIKLGKPFVERIDSFQNKSRKVTSCILPRNKAFINNQPDFQNATTPYLKISNLNESYQYKTLEFQKRSNIKFWYNDTYNPVIDSEIKDYQKIKSKSIPLVKYSNSMNYTINYIPYRLSKQKCPNSTVQSNLNLLIPYLN